MTLPELLELDLWQVRRLAAQLEIDARINEIMAKGHGAGAVRDYVRLKGEELNSDA